MRQSTLIFSVLLFVFIVYITVRGQLPAYLALFKSKSNTTVKSGGGSFGGGGASGSWDPTALGTSSSSTSSIDPSSLESF